MKSMKFKLFVELNHWWVRKSGMFKLTGFQKLEYNNSIWYILELYLLRFGIEVRDK